MQNKSNLLKWNLHMIRTYKRAHILYWLIIFFAFMYHLIFISVFFSTVSFHLLLCYQYKSNRSSGLFPQPSSSITAQIWPPQLALHCCPHPRFIQWSGNYSKAASWPKLKASPFHNHRLHYFHIQSLWGRWWREIWEELALLDRYKSTLHCCMKISSCLI